MAIDVSKMSREDKIATLSAGAHEASRKRKAQEEAQGIQRKTPIFQARGLVVYRTKETPKAPTQENQKLQDLTNNTVDSLTATAYKRQRPAAKMANFQDLTPESQQGTDIAQKTLDAYIASPQRQAAMQREQDWVNARQTGQAVSDTPPKDETLERLQAAAKKEQAANQERKDIAADRAVYDEDMREISGMTDAEQQQLKDYVSVRDLGRTENLITDLIYIPIKKRKAAGSLWDKYGEARLNELAETYARDPHQQERQEVKQAAQNASQGVGGAALTTLGSIVAKPIGSVAALEGRLDELGQRTGRYSTLDPYSPGDTVNNFFDDAKQNVQQQIEGDGANIFRKGAAVLYQAGTGAVENVLGAITLGPGVTAAVNATGQLTRTISEASQRGATAGQAYLLATSSAALDYAMDKIPLDTLFGLAKEGSTSALKAALNQAGIEATTEGASFIGSQLLDMAILQDNSEYEQNIQNYMAQDPNMSYADAKHLANKDLIDQARQQLLVAGISGGVSAGVSTAIGNARNRRAQALLDTETAPEAPTDTAPTESATEQSTPKPDTTLTDTTPEPAVDQPLQNPQQLPQAPTLTPEQIRAAQQEAALQAVQDQAAANPSGMLSDIDKRRERLKTYLNEAWSEGDGSDELRDALQRMWYDENALNFRTDDDYLRHMEATLPDLEAGDGKTAAQVRQDFATPTAKFVHDNRVNAERDAVRNLNVRTRSYENARDFYGADSSEANTAKYFMADAEQKLQNIRGLNDGMYAALEGRNSEHERVTRRYQDLAYKEFYGRESSLGNSGRSNNPRQQDLASNAVDKTHVSNPEYKETVPLEAPLDTVSRTVEEATTQRRTQQEAARQAVQDQAAAMTGGQESAVPYNQQPVSDSKAAKTGESITLEGFHGEGKAKGEIYAHAQIPVAGEGRYFAPTEKGASNYGDNVSREIVHFDRPFVIRDDSDWGGLVDAAGLKYRNPAYLSTAEAKQYTDRIRDFLTGNGYDGLIVSYESARQGDRNTVTGGWARTIDNVFGGDQYVKYDTGTENSASAEPSVGAADQNFTGTVRYQNLLSDDNVKPDRASDIRADEVPEMDGSQRVSDMAKDLMGSKNTTEAGADQVKQLIDSGVFSYDPKSNKQSVQEAFDDLNARGAAAIRHEIDTNLKNGVIADGDVTKAVVLANQYIQTGDEASAAEMMSDLSLLAQKSGRNLQLFSLIRRMTPEGQLDVLQKAADKMLSQGKQPKESKKNGAPSPVDASGPSGRPKTSLTHADIPVELKNQYIEAARSKDTQKIDAATRAIAQAVGSQYHATFKEKWDAWRYMCMLGNASTNVRNIAGNAMFKPYTVVKDELAAIFEKALPQDQRTKAMHTDKDLLAWAKEDTKSVDAQNALKYSAKMGDDVTSDIMSENKRIFKSGALETARKVAEWAPSAGDMIFKNGYYAKYLANFLTARGISADDVRAGKVDTDIVSQARQYAVDNAYINTFNDRNNFSDALASLGSAKSSKNPVTRAFGTAVDAILPFRRTPANILVRFKEYSPVEILSAGVKLKQGKITASDFCNSLATGLTGSAAMGLGAALGHGIFNSNGDGVRLITKATDEEKLQGKQDYSVEVTVNGETYSATVDWAAPANLPLFVGTNLYAAATKSSEENADFADTLINFADSAKDTLEPMLSLSCLSSLNDLLENIKYTEDGEYLYKIAASAATSYLTQGIPSLLRQTATFTQTEKQTTFANDDRKAVRDVQRTLSNIPFAGNALGLKTDKIDVWGQKQSTGSVAQRAFNAYLNPSKISKVTSDATTAELERLSKTEYGTGVTPELAPKTLTYTDKQGVTHKDVRLTAKQWEDCAITRGQTSKQILDKLVKSSDYAKLGDSGKAAAIGLVYKFADEAGAIKAMSDHDGYSETWMREAEEAKDPGTYILKKVNNQQMKAAMDKLTTAWAHNSDRPAAKRDLESAYETYAKSSANIRNAVMDAAKGTVKQYLEAREDGLDSNVALSVIKQVQSIPVKKRQNAAYQYQAVANTKGLSEAQMDTAMKLYMPDYDPTVKKPVKTEVKYDYIRQELGFSAREYAKAAYAMQDMSYDEDDSESLDKDEQIKALMGLGYDKSTATKFYRIYKGSSNSAKYALNKFIEENY